PVGREVEAARRSALEAALSSFEGDMSPSAQAVRQEFMSHLSGAGVDSSTGEPSHQAIHRRALEAARRVVFDMRARDEIGDDAFHLLEEEFDRVEMGS